MFYAWMQLHGMLGIDVDFRYDYTCSTVGTWPDWASDEAEPLYFKIESGACVFAYEHQLYSTFVDGDFKRCSMDAVVTACGGASGCTNNDGALAAKGRRTASAFGGKKCAPWANADGHTPQPWGETDQNYACVKAQASALTGDAACACQANVVDATSATACPALTGLPACMGDPRCQWGADADATCEADIKAYDANWAEKMYKCEDTVLCAEANPADGAPWAEDTSGDARRYFEFETEEATCYSLAYLRDNYAALRLQALDFSLGPAAPMAHLCHASRVWECAFGSSAISVEPAA